MDREVEVAPTRGFHDWSDGGSQKLGRDPMEPSARFEELQDRAPGVRVTTKLCVVDGAQDARKLTSRGVVPYAIAVGDYGDA